MKTIVSFVAYNREEVKIAQGPNSTSAFLSAPVFEQVRRLIGKGNSRSIEVLLDEDDPVYHDVVSLIEGDLGKAPCRYIGVGVRRGKEFSVRRKHVYTKDELDAAEILLLLPSPNLARLDSIRDGTPVIKLDSRLKNMRLYGGRFQFVRG